MKLDPKVLGAGLLASGPIMIQVAPNKEVWWAGFAALVIGPILMAFKRK